MVSSRVDIWNMALGNLGVSEFVESETDAASSTEAGACSRNYDNCLREVLEALPWPWARRQAPLVDIGEQTDEYTGDAARLVFEITHAFVSSSQITVEVDGAELDDDEFVVTPATTDADLAYVTFDSAPADAAAVVITVTTTRVGWEHIYALPSDCVTPVALLYQDVRLSLMTAESQVPFAIVPNDAGVALLLCTDLTTADFEALEYVGLMTYVPLFSAHFVTALAWRLAAAIAGPLTKDVARTKECWSEYSAALLRAAAYENNRDKQPGEPMTPSEMARG